MASWEGAGEGALSGAATGAGIGGPWGAVIGGAAGALLGGLSGGGSSDTPQYQDPNAEKRQILANNLMSSKTGEEYAAHQSAMNEHRGQEMFDSLSRDYSGNPAVSNSLYNSVERNVENENSSAGIEGARINEDNQKSAANILNEDSQLGFKEWTANTDRASMPSPLETIATNALGKFAGSAAGAAGQKLINGSGGGGGDEGGSGDGSSSFGGSYWDSLPGSGKSNSYSASPSVGP